MATNTMAMAKRYVAPDGRGCVVRTGAVFAGSRMTPAATLIGPDRRDVLVSGRRQRLDGKAIEASRRIPR